MAENKIRVGDRVVVEVSNFLENVDYSIYSKSAGILVYAGFYNIIERFVKGDIPIEEKPYLVLKVCQDLRKEEIFQVAVIMDTITKQLYVVPLDCLTYIDISNYKMNLQAALDLRLIITSLVSQIPGLSPNSQELVIDNLYNSIEMIRLKNFIEGVE